VILTTQKYIYQIQMLINGPFIFQKNVENKRQAAAVVVLFSHSFQILI